MIFKSFEEEQKELHLNMYKYILEGRQHGFPQGFWYEEGDKDTFKTFLLYYLYEVLNYPKDKIPYKDISKKVISEGKLLSAYQILFEGRIEILFKEIFPEAYPYKMPHISDELWHGTGIHEGKTPLKNIFPNWYFEEYLGLTEDNVVGLIELKDEEDDEESAIYKGIIKNKYRSLAECICCAFPNKDNEAVKSGIKARTTSRVALKKRREKDPTKELTEKIKIFKSDNNCYFTNTGCNIHMYIEDGIEKLRIIHYDRKPTYREIKYIRYKLLDKATKNFYFDIDKYSNEVILIEEVNKPTYTSFDSELILSDIKKSPVTKIEYPVSITKDGGAILHLSVSFSDPKTKFIEIEEIKALKDILLPKDKLFGMFFPPEAVFANIHRNCFHLFEIQ
ncbi:MAG: DUF4046 domain-containing protein [Clostridium sp.]|nr:DUF4046 domain-containing protein [Clostridium sp.]